MARPQLNKVDRTGPKRKKGGGVNKTGGGGRRVTRSPSKRPQEVLDAKSEANAKSMLLSLPGELRNKIYEFAIGGNDVGFIPTVESEESDESDESEKFTTMASPCRSDVKFTMAAWNQIFYLSRVCRQIHQETKVLPFRLDRFVVHAGYEIGPFLKTMESYKKQNITTIAFISTPGSDSSISKKLETPHVEEFAKKKGCKHVVERKEADENMDLEIIDFIFGTGKWGLY